MTRHASAPSTQLLNPTGSAMYAHRKFQKIINWHKLEHNNETTTFVP